MFDISKVSKAQARPVLQLMNRRCTCCLAAGWLGVMLFF